MKICDRRVTYLDDDIDLVTSGEDESTNNASSVNELSRKLGLEGNIDEPTGVMTIGVPMRLDVELSRKLGMEGNIDETTGVMTIGVPMRLDVELDGQ